LLDYFKVKELSISEEIRKRGYALALFDKTSMG